MDIATVTTNSAVRSFLHIKDILNSNDMENAFLQGNNEVISRLKFLGCIERDEKINTRLLQKQSNTIYTKLARWLIFPDNRGNTLRFISGIISRSFEILEKCLSEHRDTTVRNIIIDIEQAKQGLYNLIHTYKDDTITCCTIQVTIQDIETKLMNIKEHRPDLFANSESQYVDNPHSQQLVEPEKNTL